MKIGSWRSKSSSFPIPRLRSEICTGAWKARAGRMRFPERAGNAAWILLTCGRFALIGARSSIGRRRSKSCRRGNITDMWRVKRECISCTRAVKARSELPLILTHGWPGSFLEMLKIIPLLTDAGFDVVAPSLPGFGFSDRPTRPGMNTFRIAELWAGLMGELGYTRFVAQGGDFGASVSTILGLRYRGPRGRHPSQLHSGIISAGHGGWNHADAGGAGISGGSGSLVFGSMAPTHICSATNRRLRRMR